MKVEQAIDRKIITNINWLYNSAAKKGILSGMEDVTGLPIRRLTLRGRPGRGKQELLYSGTEELHQKYVETFNRGGWVGNIWLPTERGRIVKSPRLVIRFLRRILENEYDDKINEVVACYSEGGKFLIEGPVANFNRNLDCDRDANAKNVAITLRRAFRQGLH